MAVNADDIITMNKALSAVVDEYILNVSGPRWTCLAMMATHHVAIRCDFDMGEHGLPDDEYGIDCKRLQKAIKPMSGSEVELSTSGGTITLVQPGRRRKVALTEPAYIKTPRRFPEVPSSISCTTQKKDLMAALNALRDTGDNIFLHIEPEGIRIRNDIGIDRDEFIEGEEHVDAQVSDGTPAWSLFAMDYLKSILSVMPDGPIDLTLSEQAPVTITTPSIQAVVAARVVPE